MASRVRGPGARVAAVRSGTQGLRAVRAVRRGRGEHLSAGDTSYRIYLGVMLSVTVVAPIVRVLLLSVGPVVLVLGSAQLPGIAAGLTVATAGAVLLGGYGGPVRAGLPQLDLLFTSAIPRSLLLARPVLGWLGAAALLGAVAGALLAIGGALAAPIAPGASVTLLAAGACLGVLWGGAQLVGQIGPRVRAIVVGALCALALAQLLWGPLGDPWSGVARIVVGLGSAGPGVPGGAVGFAVIALSSGVVLLGALSAAARLDRERLRAQAATWGSARALALTGDPSAALAKLGRPVTMGRRLRLRGGRGGVASFVRRDLLGIVRAPGRSLAAGAGALLAGVLWAAAVTEPGGVLSAAVLGGAALLIATISLAPWCRGIVTAAAGSGSPPLPPLLPSSPRALLARHAVAPLILAVLALGVGGAAFGWVWSGWAWGGWAWAGPGGEGSAALRALATAPVAAVAAVLLRIAAALKGTIPLRLLAPVPTAAGDLAAINVFVWSIDGPVVAAVSGAALGALWAATAGSGLLTLAVAAVGTLVVLAALLGWIGSRVGASGDAP